jgi:hypothetical protein
MLMPGSRRRMGGRKGDKLEPLFKEKSSALHDPFRAALA